MSYFGAESQRRQRQYIIQRQRWAKCLGLRAAPVMQRPIGRPAVLHQTIYDPFNPTACPNLLFGMQICAANELSAVDLDPQIGSSVMSRFILQISDSGVLKILFLLFWSQILHLWAKISKQFSDNSRASFSPGHDSQLILPAACIADLRPQKMRAVLALNV